MDFDLHDKLAMERAEKQNFLKTEIIQKGYDTQQFSTFLNTKRKNGGTNIDLWSTFELKRLVVEFQKIVDKQTAQQAEALDSDAKSNKQLSSGSTQDGDIADNLKDDLMSEVYRVRVSQPSPLNEEKNVYSSVTDPEFIKGGFFSSSYIQYTVTTRPFGWAVKRRFSDFLWLRSVVQKMHLGYVVAPVPKKKIKGEFENNFIHKRMYFLERFLNSILMNEDFKSNNFVYFFLSLQDDNQFRARRKEGEKLIKIAKFEEISNVAGQAKLEISADLKTFAANAGELCSQAHPIYKKIRKLNKQLMTALDSAANSAFNLGEWYAALFEVSTAFNEGVSMGKQPEMEEYYLVLNNYMTLWGENMVEQTKIVQDYMVYFYKYAYYENQAFLEALQARAKAGLEYIQKKKELLAKKEKLFQQGDVTKWDLAPNVLKEYTKEGLLINKAFAFDLMLPKETEALKELRDVFAYQNVASFDTLEKGMKEKCNQYRQNFRLMTKEQDTNSAEMRKHWINMMPYFGGEGRKKRNIQIMHRTIQESDKNNPKNYGNFTDE